MADDVTITFAAEISELTAALSSVASQLNALGRSFAGLSGHAEGAMTKIAQSNAKTVQGMKQAWSEVLEPVGHSIDSFAQGVILKHETVRQAVARSLQQILSSYISTVIHLTETWAEGQLANTTAVYVQSGNQTAATRAAGAEQATDAAASANSSILSHAGSAAAAVYDDVSQIPYVGWILAPPAAAAAFAAVLAYSVKASAAGGMWEVPGEILSVLHPEESVLPAGVAGPMRDFFSNGGSSGSSSSQGSSGQGGAFVFAPVINNQNMDAKSVAQMFNDPQLLRSVASNLSSYWKMNPSTRPSY